MRHARWADGTGSSDGTLMLLTLHPSLVACQPVKENLSEGFHIYLGIDQIPVKDPLMQQSVMQSYKGEGGQSWVRFFVHYTLIDPLAYDLTDKSLVVAVDGFEHRFEI